MKGMNMEKEAEIVEGATVDEKSLQSVEPRQVPLDQKPGRQHLTLFERRPKEMVEYATEVANTLKDVIEKQGLIANIQGNNYVMAEGWSTLGTMIGIMPNEKEVRRLEDGSYEAIVELLNVHTGQIVGTGSALCSVKEKRWGKADDYARRSMAITRATGKAYRQGLGWIVTLAGYKATPAEEMPDNLFNVSDRVQAERLSKYLIAEKVDPALHQPIGYLLDGKVFNKRTVSECVEKAAN
jgi:hypothetical protein